MASASSTKKLLLIYEQKLENVFLLTLTLINKKILGCVMNSYQLTGFNFFYLKIMMFMKKIQVKKYF